MVTTHKGFVEILNGRQWHVLDAKGSVLGRLASQAAGLLIGKHRAFISPHMDCGDFVVVTNASEIKLTGNKLRDKGYFQHSGYPAGGKVVPIRDVLAKRPERVIELAVRRMLPKNKLGDRMLTRLKVYKGADHPHQAQVPAPKANGG